jgi:hypothetical protein
MSSANLGRAVLELATKDEELNKGMDEAKKKADETAAHIEERFKKIDFKEAGKKAGNFLGGLAKAGPAAAATVGIAAGAIGIDFVKSVDEGIKATNNLQAKLGLTAEGAQAMGKLGKEVFRDGWGESLGQVNDTLGKVLNSFGDLGDADLKEVTKQALIVSNTFDQDVNDVLRASSTLANNFGLDAKDSLDLVMKGFQLGGDKSGDLLDTLNEYSVQFRDLGYDAKEFGNILVNGLENGAFNADKVADAVKEFNIRIQDGSKTTASALGSLGINAEEFAQKLGSGAMTGKEAMELINERLRSTEDTVKRNQLGVALYGTQWEDMGPQVVLALDKGRDALGNFQGTTKTAGDALQNNLGSQVDKAMRQLGEMLSPFMAEATKFLTANLPAIQKGFQDFASLLQPIFDIIGKAWDEKLKPAFDKLVEFMKGDGKKIFDDFVAFLKNPVLPTIGELAAFIIDPLIPAVMKIGKTFFDVVKPVIEGVVKFIRDPLIPVFRNVIDVVTNLGSVFGVIWGGIQSAVDFGGKVMITTFGAIVNSINFLGNVFKTVVDGIGTVWNTITGAIGTGISLIKGVISGAANIMVNAVNFIIDGINAVIEAIAGADFGPFTDPLGFLRGLKIGRLSFVPAYASGTDFHPGGMALVGEQGPELVNLPRGAQVLPAFDTNRLMGSGSTTTNNNGSTFNITINTTGPVSEQKLVAIMDNRIAQAQRQQGQRANSRKNFGGSQLSYG